MIGDHRARQQRQQDRGRQNRVVERGDRGGLAKQGSEIGTRGKPGRAGGDQGAVVERVVIQAGQQIVRQPAAEEPGRRRAQRLGAPLPEPASIGHVGVRHVGLLHIALRRTFAGPGAGPGIGLQRRFDLALGMQRLAQQPMRLGVGLGQPGRLAEGAGRDPVAPDAKQRPAQGQTRPGIVGPGRDCRPQARQAALAHDRSSGLVNRNASAPAAPSRHRSLFGRAGPCAPDSEIMVL